MRHVFIAAAAVVLAFAGPAAAESKPEDYLTKDGKLKETLEIRDLQGGFAGFTGHAWIVEKDGSWKSARVGPNDKLDVEAKGTLSKEQLADLAKMPSRQELLAKLVGTMQAPIAKFVRTLNEVPGKFARTLAAVRDQKEKQAA